MAGLLAQTFPAAFPWTIHSGELPGNKLSLQLRVQHRIFTGFPFNPDYVIPEPIPLQI
jgi:hypothetical protein